MKTRERPMKRNRTIAPIGKRPASTAMASTRLALLTLGAKKAAEVWQSRRQPPPPPSLRQRLGGPAKVTLVAAGVGGAAYFATKSGVMTQLKERLGRSNGAGPEQATSFGPPGAGVESDPVVERAETPPKIVYTDEPASSLTPEPPPPTTP
jgi:hypothetical protein